MSGMDVGYGRNDRSCRYNCPVTVTIKSLRVEEFVHAGKTKKPVLGDEVSRNEESSGVSIDLFICILYSFRSRHG